MHCSRCQGLMLKHHFVDLASGFGEMWTDSWRCVNCGAVYDTVVERNRLMRESEVSVPACDDPDMEDEEIFLGVEALVRSSICTALS